MTEFIDAHIQMFKEEDRGRCSPILEGYCPHIVVDNDKEYLGVYLIETPKHAPILPDETSEVIFALLYYPSMSYHQLQVGSIFRILEGARSVGSGVVLKRWTLDE